MTPSPISPKVYEIYDISYYHIDDLEEDIRIYGIEEKICCTSIPTFSSDSPLNSMQNFPVIASKSGEEFDFSPYNVAADV